MRTISEGAAQRWVPNGSRRSWVARSSAFSVRGARRCPRARPRPPGRRSLQRRASPGRTPSARTGRRAERGSSRRRARAARPGARLDLGREHHATNQGLTPRGASPHGCVRGVDTVGLVLDGLLGPGGQQEAERPLPLLGEMGEQAGRAREDRDGLDRGGRVAEVEQHRRDGHGHVHRQRLPPGIGDGVAGERASRTCGPLAPRASASSRIRSARGSTGRCSGCRSPAPCRRPRGSHARRRGRRPRETPLRPPAPAPARGAARTPPTCPG